MNTIRFFSIWAAVTLLLAGCGQEAVEVVAVNFEATEADFESQVASIELLPLQRDPQLRMGYAPSLYAFGDDWLLLERDPMAEPDFRTCKLYRYDNEGRFLNAIGRKGDRLDELFRIDNLQFRDGNVIVFSLEPAGGGEKVITYDAAGHVLSAQHFDFAGGQSLLLEDGILTYYGHGDRHGREGRLMRYSEEGLQRQAFLTERTAPINVKSQADVLYPTDKGVVVIDTFSDTLWCYNAGKLQPYLVMDLGAYSMGDEFFAIEDMRDGAKFFRSSQFAMVNRYLENGTSRLIELSVQTTDRKRNCLYGYNGGSGWRWFRPAAPFEGAIQLLDGPQALCLLEPAQLPVMSDSLRSRITNPEVLSGIVPEDNYVIARISFTE